MPNREHLAKLKEGVEAWNKWRRVNSEVRPNLNKANLTGAILIEAGNAPESRTRGTGVLLNYCAEF
jgi:hypothetical protein